MKREPEYIGPETKGEQQARIHARASERQQAAQQPIQAPTVELQGPDAAESQSATEDVAPPAQQMNWAGGPSLMTPSAVPATPLSPVRSVPNCNEQVSGVDAICGFTNYGRRG